MTDGVWAQARRIDAEVGDRIRLLRRAHGVSQAELGANLGVGFAQIQKIENGSNRCGAGRLWQIAQHFRVPVGYFFGEIRVREEKE